MSNYFYGIELVLAQRQDLIMSRENMILDNLSFYKYPATNVVEVKVVGKENISIYERTITTHEFFYANRLAGYEKNLKEKDHILFDIDRNQPVRYSDFTDGLPTFDCSTGYVLGCVKDNNANDIIDKKSNSKPCLIHATQYPQQIIYTSLEKNRQKIKSTNTVTNTGIFSTFSLITNLTVDNIILPGLTDAISTLPFPSNLYTPGKSKKLKELFAKEEDDDMELPELKLFLVDTVDLSTIVDLGYKKVLSLIVDNRRITVNIDISSLPIKSAYIKDGIFYYCLENAYIYTPAAEIAEMLNIAEDSVIQVMPLQ